MKDASRVGSGWKLTRTVYASESRRELPAATDDESVLITVCRGQVWRRGGLPRYDKFMTYSLLRQPAVPTMLSWLSRMTWMPAASVRLSTACSRATKPAW